MMRLRDRLIKGTVFNLIAVAFNQGSTLIANIIVARILMRQGFGEYAMVQSTLLTVAALSQLAIGYTASKYIAEYRSSDPEKAGRIMGLCALISAVMAGVGAFLLIVIAPWLAGAMLKAPHLAVALMIGSGFLFFSAINGYQTGALSGLEAFGSLAKAGVVSGIVAVAAIFLGAWWGGLNGTIIGLSISAFVRCAIHNRWLRLESRVQGIEPRYRGSLSQEKAVIFKFALPAAIAGYYSMPMIWLANAFLVRQPKGYGEMALYASSSSVRLLVLFIPQVINNVSLSILNNIRGSGDEQRYKRAYRSNVVIIFLATLTGGLVIGLFGDTILGIFGKEFRGGKMVLQVLMISTVFEGVAIALYQHLQAQGKIWTSLFFINIPRETVFVVLAFIFVPVQGAVGLSVAYTLCWLLTLVAICILVYREQIATKNNQSSVNISLP
ncbi:MAG: oligosaccharide flippase family protein [Chloroflexi bacterium]|nr:oligosaccharide flippase family protein [Chloroflexota bacterium]